MRACVSARQWEAQQDNRTAAGVGGRCPEQRPHESARCKKTPKTKGPLARALLLELERSRLLLDFFGSLVGLSATSAQRRRCSARRWQSPARHRRQPGWRRRRQRRRLAAVLAATSPAASPVAAAAASTPCWAASPAASAASRQRHRPGRRRRRPRRPAAGFRGLVLAGRQSEDAGGEEDEELGVHGSLRGVVLGRQRLCALRVRLSPALPGCHC